MAGEESCWGCKALEWRNRNLKGLAWRLGVGRSRIRESSSIGASWTGAPKSSNTVVVAGRMGTVEFMALERVLTDDAQSLI